MDKVFDISLALLALLNTTDILAYHLTFYLASHPNYIIVLMVNVYKKTGGSVVFLKNAYTRDFLKRFPPRVTRGPGGTLP